MLASNENLNTPVFYLERIFSLKCAFADFPSNILLWIFFRIFFRVLSFWFSFVDFLPNILSWICFRIFFRWFSFEYSYGDFLSNMVMRDYTKNQLTGVLYDGTVTKGFAKSIKKGDFGSNIIHGFSFEYSFADLHSNENSFSNFLQNILLRIFLRIFFCEFSFEYSFLI